MGIRTRMRNDGSETARESIWRGVRRAGMGMGLALAGVMAGCSGLGDVPPPPQVLDISTSGELRTSLPPRVPLVVSSVEAAPLLRGDGVIWREEGSLAPNAYASYQWASPPGELFAQRLRDRLSLEGPVVLTNVSGTLPEVRVYLDRFEQVFKPGAMPGQVQSTGEIAVRVVLTQNGQVIDQLRFAMSVPAETNDAPGGAYALRQGVDAATDAVAQWLARQPQLRHHGG